MSATIEVSNNFFRSWKKWKVHFKMRSIQLSDKFIDVIKMKKQQEFYNSLPDPRQNRRKALESIKLRKNYRK